MTREKQIEYFKGCLMATGREGIEDLLDFIEELGFYDGKSRIKTPGQEPEEGTGKDQQGIKECGISGISASSGAVKDHTPINSRSGQTYRVQDSRPGTVKKGADRRDQKSLHYGSTGKTGSGRKFYYSLQYHYFLKSVGGIPVCQSGSRVSSGALF